MHPMSFQEEQNLLLEAGHEPLILPDGRLARHRDTGITKARNGAKYATAALSISSPRFIFLPLSLVRRSYLSQTYRRLCGGAACIASTLRQSIDQGVAGYSHRPTSRKV